MTGRILTREELSVLDVDSDFVWEPAFPLINATSITIPAEFWEHVDSELAYFADDDIYEPSADEILARCATIIPIDDANDLADNAPDNTTDNAPDNTTDNITNTAECCICKEPQISQECVITQCSHIYHKKCLTDMVNQRLFRCALCRGSL